MYDGAAARVNGGAESSMQLACPRKASPRSQGAAEKDSPSSTASHWSHVCLLAGAPQRLSASHKVRYIVIHSSLSLSSLEHLILIFDTRGEKYTCVLRVCTMVFVGGNNFVMLGKYCVGQYVLSVVGCQQGQKVIVVL